MKRRCSGCKEYFEKEDMWRQNNLIAFCSKACSAGQPKTKPTSKSKIPDDIRTLVRERDGNRCRRCPRTEALDLHHIVYRSQGGQHTMENLIQLCRWCHIEVHSDKKKYQPILLAMIDD